MVVYCWFEVMSDVQRVPVLPACALFIPRSCPELQYGPAAINTHDNSHFPTVNHLEINGGHWRDEDELVRDFYLCQINKKTDLKDHVLIENILKISYWYNSMNSSSNCKNVHLFLGLTMENILSRKCHKFLTWKCLFAFFKSVLYLRLRNKCIRYAKYFTYKRKCSKRV